MFEYGGIPKMREVYKVFESELENKRVKQIIIPAMSDIERISNYGMNNMSIEIVFDDDSTKILLLTKGIMENT